MFSLANTFLTLLFSVSILLAGGTKTVVLAEARGVHGSGRVGFRPKPNSTRLNRFPGFGIRIRPNIGSDPIYRVFGLSGSESSVSRAGPQIGPDFLTELKLQKIHFFGPFYLIYFQKRPFRPYRNRPFYLIY